MFLLAIFWNDHERRLRCFWRLLLAAGLCVLLTLTTIVVPLLAPQPLLQAAVGSVLALGAVLLTAWFAARFLDRRPAADVGFRLNVAWWLDWTFGLALGAGLMAGIFLIERYLGWLVITEWMRESGTTEQFVPGMLSLVALFICVGIYEEVAFRGYLLRNLAEGFHFRATGPAGALALAIVLTASLFGAVHASNPGASSLSVANTILSGLYFGAAFVWTGRLALPIGFHISWNFTQAAVFGFPVSGVDLGLSFLGIRQTGPPLWTGNDYGPEGGLLATLALLAALLLMALWVQFRQGSVTIQRALAEPPPGHAAAPVSAPVELLKGET